MDFYDKLGVTVTIVKTTIAPIERVKLILQTQNSSFHIVTGKRKIYNGIFDCFKRLPREQGFFSFWRGHGTNLIRHIPAHALNFSFYSAFKVYLLQATNEKSKYQSVLAMVGSGFFAGLLVTTLTYPLKFCQTRLSLDMGSEHLATQDVKREFSGLGNCVKVIWRKEGLVGLYRGYSLAVVVSTIYRALYFGLFDSLKFFWAFQRKHTPFDTQTPAFLKLIFAQMSSICAGLCVYPMDTVGRRLMLESGRIEEMKVFGGARCAFKLIYRKEGVAAFYKGALTNSVRSFGSALVLVTYDEFQHTRWRE